MTKPPSGWLVLKWPRLAGFEVATDNIRLFYKNRWFATSLKPRDLAGIVSATDSRIHVKYERFNAFPDWFASERRILTNRVGSLNSMVALPVQSSFERGY